MLVTPNTSEFTSNRSPLAEGHRSGVVALFATTNSSNSAGDFPHSSLVTSGRSLYWYGIVSIVKTLETGCLDRVRNISSNGRLFGMAGLTALRELSSILRRLRVWCSDASDCHHEWVKVSLKEPYGIFATRNVGTRLTAALSELAVKLRLIRRSPQRKMRALDFRVARVISRSHFGHQFH